MVSSCLAATGVAAAFISAYPAKAFATTACSPSITSTTSTIQTWSGGCMSVTNSGTINASGVAVTVTGASQSTLTNAGKIAGASGVGVNLVAGSVISINNVSTGTISGGQAAIAVATSSSIGGPATISALTNSGSIGGNGFGVMIGVRGSVTSIVNSVGGLIQSAGSSVRILGTLGALTNSGSIGGNIAIWERSGASIGTIANSAGGVLSGYGTSAIYIGGHVGTLSNSGTIAEAIDIGGGGSISSIVNSAGSIASIINGGGISKIVIKGGTLGALNNSGLIRSDLAISVGSSAGIGTITNSLSGQIVSTSSTGLAISGSVGTLTNSGSISGYTGVSISAGGGVSSIVNSGSIGGRGGSSSSGVGLVVNGRLGALTNTGTISGGAGGINIGSSGSVGSISNQGLISSSSGVGVSVGGTLGALTNSGAVVGGWVGEGVVVGAGGAITSIVNSLGALISGGYSGIGVNRGGAVSVITNSGTIASRGTAVWTEGAIGLFTNSGVVGSQGATVSRFGIEITNASASIMGTLGTLRNLAGGVITGSADGVLNNGAMTAVYNAGSIISSVGIGLNVGHSNGNGSIILVANSGLISGYAGVEVNVGGIGTISNTGTITASGFNGAAISNSNGTIGSISNSNMITSAKYGVYDGGAIGPVNNSGTITGPTALYLYTNASIGPITNSGVIAGNIVNASGHDLTIAGGTGTVYGLLTGLNGLVGTIMTSTISISSGGSISIVPEAIAPGGDVTLSGNNLLNDILVLGSHSLVNTGNLQINNAISITGGFTQTSGALISGVTSPTKYGELFVSGAANVAGGSVGLTPISPALLASGQSYTLIQASSLTISSSVTAAVSGLTASISTVTAGAFQDLVLTLGAVASTPTPTPPPATNWTYVGNQTGGPASPIGVLLDKIGAGGSSQQQQFQATILTYLSGLTLAQQEHALNQLSPSQLSALSNVAVSSPALNAILQHLNIFGQARGDFELASLSDDAYGDVYGEQGRGLWGKLVGGGASRTDSAAAYRSTDYGLVFGADLYRTSNALWGVSGSWLHANVTGNGALSGSTNAVDSYQLTAYGALKPSAWGGHWLVSGQAAYAYNRYDQARRIDAFAVTARAAYVGQQYLANGTVGYVFNRQGYNLTAYTGLKEVHVSNAHYIEGGAGQLDMQIAALSLDSFSQEVGVKYDAVTNGPYGKLYPEVSVGWTHDYTNGPIPITGSLAGVTFVEPSKRTSADGVELGAGVNAQLKGWAIGVEYQGELRSGFQSHTAALKANWKF